MKNLLQKLKGSFRTRSWRAGAYSVFAALLVIAMAVVANLAVSALPASVTQLDWTANKLYSLSRGTEQILASLDKDIDIYWLVEEGHENNTMQQILGKYGEYDRVTVTRVDPVRYPSFAADYTDQTVESNSLAVVCGDRSLYIPYSDVWTYSDYETYAYYLEYYQQPYLDVFTGEEKLTAAILSVTSDSQPVMYTLTGHGEAGVSEDVLSAVALENIRTQELNLLTAEAVPEDCAVLAILAPERDLNARELELLEDYAGRGGQFLVTTAYTAEEMTNFKALLADFGIDLVGGYVMESDSRYYSYGYIDLVIPAIGRHEITAPLTEEDSLSVVMPDSQALLDATEEVSPVTVTALLTSSETSYVKQDVEGVDSYEKAEGDQMGPFLLGAASEDESTGARLAVFSSSRFMESDFNELVAGANRDLFLNSIDWLCRQEQSISIHPKTLTGEYLSFTDSAAGVLKVALAVVVPVLFLAAGIGIFIKRRRR